VKLGKGKYYNLAAGSTVTGIPEEFIKIKDAAQAESMVDYIFGTDCYSKAVKSLEKGCKLMTPEEHSTLAFLLTKCFLDNSGRKTMRCSNKDHIRDCTSNMDEDSFATYQHFFINIYKWVDFERRLFLYLPLVFVYSWRTTTFRSRLRT